MLGIKRNNEEIEGDQINDETIDLNNNEIITNKRFKKDLISFEKKLPSIPIIKGKQINITSFSGHRVTRQVKLSTTTPNLTTNSTSNTTLFNDLLKKPINEILQEIEDIEQTKLKSELMKKQTTTVIDEPSNEIMVNKDNRLWVDKYAPSSFHDLLSDNTMNLEILNWLELWDHVVFGKPLKRNLVMPSSNNNINITSDIGNGKNNNNNKVGGGYFNNHQHHSKFSTSLNSHQQHQNQGQYLLQEDGTPIVKIILLTGGPGLGKTTLAHVLAKQAKYNPIEINASEDRSGDAFESKLLSAIEMKSLFADKRPNCLIIDEIDGISGRDNGPIELLIKLIDNSLKQGTNINNNKNKPTSTSQTKKSNKNESDDEGDGDDDEDSDNEQESNNSKQDNGKLIKTKVKGSKKKIFRSRILRPIICICNDQYVPSLRKLRQKAMVFNFQSPQKHELLSRLKYICSSESLIATDSTLNTLIEMTGSDIRACINSLQFIKSKTSVLNSELLKNKSNIVIGQKDMEKGLFEIWGNIFKNPSSLNNSIGNNNSIKISGYSSSGSTIQKRKSKEVINNEYLAQLDLQIEGCNQIDKLMDGLHENYLTNMNSDFSMEKTVDCLDWMVFGDQMLHVHADDKYRSIIPLAVHQRGCTTFNTPKIVSPHSDYDNFIKKKLNSNIKDSFFSDLPALVYSYLTKKCFNIDFIYPFFDILALPVRVTNTELYSLKEKASLNQLAEIMKFYHLSYKLEKITVTQNNNQFQTQNNQTMQFKLEPPIDTLLHFQHLPAANQVKHINLSHQQKSIISIAVQQYKPPKVKQQQQPQQQEIENKKKPTTPAAVFKKPQPIKPLAPTVLKDFFGRVIQISPESKKKATAAAAALLSDPTTAVATGPNIKYRYQEGFTNAVKKVVLISDLL